MNFSTPPFSTLSSTDSLLLVLFLLLAFLVGFFIGRASLASRLKTLKKKLQERETELTTLQEHLTEQELALQSSKQQFAATETQLQREIVELTASKQNLQQQLRTQQEPDLQSPNVFPLERLNALEQKMNLLESENRELQLAVEVLQGGVEEIEIDLQPDEDIPETYDSPSPNQKAALAKVALKKHFGKKIPLADISQKDSLQLLDGIGPFIETQLNGIGIYTFKQISCFDAEIIELVTEAIQFFPGRIAKDQWKEQASNRLIVDK